MLDTVQRTVKSLYQLYDEETKTEKLNGVAMITQQSFPSCLI